MACNIINQELETGIFPDDWEKAKVHPILKSDERNIPSNYRPISILPAISKIIERVMHTQLLEYFQAGNLLTDSQSVFRPNHSTCTALISAVNLWLTNMDADKLNGSVFIDLKKAFDTVDHNILLLKLSCYGVNGNALQLLKSYFIDRTQRSYVNGVLSTEQYVSCGIPQGSILGPFCYCTRCKLRKKLPTCKHTLCNLKGFLFVIAALRVARKIASCNMAFNANIFPDFANVP